ncbi:S-adenosyl-L-methionine-dependent methyltransferase, partial [Jimgerdemannia flammicorona]
SADSVATSLTVPPSSSSCVPIEGSPRSGSGILRSPETVSENGNRSKRRPKNVRFSLTVRTYILPEDPDPETISPDVEEPRVPKVHTRRIPTTSRFQFVDGRRFLENKNFMLPSDNDELMRLEFQHYMLRQTFQGNFTAPMDEKLERGIKVLDVGCGSGTWILELSADFPKSHFTGSDILDTERNHTRPNVTFIVADTLGLPFEDNTFDYVMQRLMVTVFTEEQWKMAVKEMVRVVKPGGIVEIIESEVRQYERGPNYTKWNNAFYEILKRRGVYVDVTDDLGELLEPYFQEIHCDYVSYPIRWGGRLGGMAGDNIKKIVETLRPMLRPFMKMTEEGYKEMVEQAYIEMKECKTLGNLHYTFGIKPLE